MNMMNRDTKKRIKVIVSPIGLDSHTTGAEVVSMILRDAGMEVVYLGLHQMPEMVVQAALQEDADVIGISSHASNYSLIVDMMDLLREKNMNNILVICGGTVPKQHITKLKEAGVSEVFTPRSSSDSIISYILSNVRREKTES